MVLMAAGLPKAWPTFMSSFHPGLSFCSLFYASNVDIIVFKPALGGLPGLDTIDSYRELRGKGGGLLNFCSNSSYSGGFGAPP